MKRDSTATVQHDVCPKGCYMFPVGRPDIMTCPNPNCGAQRYKNADEVIALTSSLQFNHTDPLPALVPVLTLAYTSIAQKLTQFFADETRDEMLSYRKTFFDDNALNNHYRDYFSGEAYQSLLQRNIVDENTICLVLFVDGFQLKNSSKQNQTMVNCLILNIHPEQRQVNKYCIPS